MALTLKDIYDNAKKPLDKVGMINHLIGEYKLSDRMLTDASGGLYDSLVKKIKFQISLGLIWCLGNIFWWSFIIHGLKT